MVIIIAIVIKRIAYNFYMVLRLFYKTLNLEGENKQTNKTNNNNKKTFKDHLPVIPFAVLRSTVILQGLIHDDHCVGQNTEDYSEGVS